MLLYIDPGTGSMLLTILIGMISILYFFFQKVRIRLKSIIRGSRVKNDDKGHMPYVIYSDSKRYWNVFKPICDIFEEKKIPLVYWTSSPDDPALVEDYQYVKREFIGEVNRAVARLNMMNAGICLSTTPGLDVYQWKRSKNTKWYVHICHAVGDISMYRMFGTDYYDAILMSSIIQSQEISELERAHNRPSKELILAGISYMDELQKRVRAAKIEKKDVAVKTVLVAPSWGKNSILSMYGEEFLDSLVNTGYNVIIRPHPQSMISDRDTIDPLMKKYPDSEMISWNFDNDNFNSLMESDIIISDFSGVIFDYAFVFDKPVIYTEINYDRGPYDAYWLERPLWLLDALPQIGIPLKKEDFSNMRSVIEHTLKDTDLKAGRDRIREEGWQNVGKCAESTFDYMIGKYSDLYSETESA